MYVLYTSIFRACANYITCRASLAMWFVCFKKGLATQPRLASDSASFCFCLLVLMLQVLLLQQAAGLKQVFSFSGSLLCCALLGFTLLIIEKDLISDSFLIIAK